jgi:glutamine synthetase
MTPSEVLALCREKNVKVVDLRFMDFPGLWQHFSIPVSVLNEDSFEEGFGFDGSSIRGWKKISESDMIVVPEAGSALIDPFMAATTLVMICNIRDPITREDYARDPRNVAKKAENYMRSTGLADTCFFGPECEFFIFDDIRYDQTRPTPGTTSSTATRGAGTRVGRRAPTSATSRARRRVTSPFRRPTPSRTSGPR